MKTETVSISFSEEKTVAGNRLVVLCQRPISFVTDDGGNTYAKKSRYHWVAQDALPAVTVTLNYDPKGRKNPDLSRNDSPLVVTLELEKIPENEINGIIAAATE